MLEQLLPQALVRGLRVGQTVLGSGYLQAVRPDRTPALAADLLRWGLSPTAGWALAAHTEPGRVALIDDRGALTYGEIHRRTNALARTWAERGVSPDAGVAVLCHNHRGFVEATIAAAKLGARVLFLNTGFAPPQLADVVSREQPGVLVYDHGLSDVVLPAVSSCQRYVAWVDDGQPTTDPSLEEVIEAGDPAEVPAPRGTVRFVILTSGTTGAPRGAQRGGTNGIDAADSVLSKVPIKAGGTTVICPPLFHAWGLFHLATGLALRSTLVVRSRFDPDVALADVARHRASTLVVVPVMLQRLLDLGTERLSRYQPFHLRAIVSSGSALPAPLATRTMATFGDVLYNVYGSTEVAWASIATPQDLRTAPGTAGRPPRGTIVRLYDDTGEVVAEPNRTGRVFVGSRLQFEGYTGGDTKQVVDGLMATGDVGHFDDAGLLWIDGRDDEMIVSGGENVFPAEVETLLAGHPDVAEAAAVGVSDEQYGQRLAAFVVVRPGSRLSEDQLKEYVRANLARYKVPRQVTFLDALPRNQTGKVLKRELASGEEGARQRGGAGDGAPV
ncbi:MAG TPA: AMP-binding protein [Acidimicrobiales bacterium]|nr:AMP-binding protein [Acidimicrobiales bacterium]